MTLQGTFSSLRRGILSASLAVAFALGVAPLALAGTWTGAIDDNWDTAGNWTDGAQIGGGTSTIDNGDTVVRDGAATITGRLFIEDGSTMNITGGSHSDNQSGASTRNFLGRGSTATINQSGGTYDIGHMLAVGGGGANGAGTYNLTGGDLILSRGSNSIVDASNPYGRPSLDVSDEEDAGFGLFEISGGSLTTRGGLYIGPAGDFSVVGSDATLIGIGTNGSVDGAFLSAGGTLSFAIDAGGITPILIDDVGTTVDGVEFRPGSEIDLSFDGGFTPAATTTYELFRSENFNIASWVDTDVSLSAGVAPEWSLSIEDDGTDGVILATYTVVPEPSTLVMLALAGVFGIVRRR